MGILKQIKREKDQRRHELLVIDRRMQKLSEWRKRLEEMQYDLTAREARILESEPFLPLARQLQEMKLEDALPWIETILEKAEAENVDIRTTAINVARELRLYRQSGDIQKQIERANQELALLNMTTIQKQHIPESNFKSWGLHSYYLGIFGTTVLSLSLLFTRVPNGITSTLLSTN